MTALGPQFLPAEYGTVPIPHGTVRINHYTRPENVASIRQQGLSRSASEAEFDKGQTESPVVFANAGRVDDELLRHGTVVEGWARPDQLAIGSEHHPDYLHERRSTVTLRDGLPADQIIAVHEPWHHAVRTILSSPHHLERTLAGDNDSALGDPVYGPAIRHVKELHKAHG